MERLGLIIAMIFKGAIGSCDGYGHSM